MRTLLLAAAFLLVTPALAEAGDPTIIPNDTAAVAAGAKLGKPAATKAIKALGKAAVYVTRDDGGQHVSLVIETTGGAVTSPVINFFSDCGMHKCDSPGKATPRLRAITVGGKPAAALELTATYTHETTNPDTGKTTRGETWQRRVFLVCNDSTCLQADFGTRAAPCTATLSATGVLAHACTTTDTLAF